MGVVVLGMHRSGTSAAARVINLLGVPFGRGRLVPITDANPAGHWESWELQDVNNDLLDAFGGSWAGPPVLSDGWELDVRAVRLEAAGVRAWNMVHPEEPWVWKDPRTCLTLPFWRRIAPLEGPAIIIYRHPDEVAASLSRRDGFSSAVALALWERYNRDALLAVQGWPVLVMPYDRLANDAVGWAGDVRSFLTDHGIRQDATVSAADAAGEVRGELRHRRAEGALEMSAPQRRLLEALAEVDGPHTRFVPPQLGEPSPWLGPLLVEHGRAYRQEMVLRSELARARSQMGTVINRTRVKVLAYKAYQHVVHRDAPHANHRPSPDPSPTDPAVSTGQ